LTVATERQIWAGFL
jgi:Folylpolyglutamate synthase